MPDITPLKTGDEIPTLEKSAFMPIDPNGRNVIHTDDYAKEYGMRGALVGGSILLGYILEMLYNQFGQNWLYHGKIKVLFIKGGAINGDQVVAHALVTDVKKEENASRIFMDIWLENKSSGKIVVGTASCIA